MAQMRFLHSIYYIKKMTDLIFLLRGTMALDNICIKILYNAPKNRVTHKLLVIIRQFFKLFMQMLLLVTFLK